MEPANAETMRCPTCAAVQVWSDACRRCKSDLRLLREAADEYAAQRRQCLINLRQNRNRAALDQARRCFALRDGEEAHRLLAVCELLNGNWDSARSQAVRLFTERTASDH